MKRKSLFIIPVLAGLLSLVSCDYFTIIPPGGSSESVEIVESEKPEGEKVKSYKVIDLNANNYMVGNNFHKDSNLVLRLEYESGKLFNEQLQNKTIHMVKHIDSNTNIGDQDFALSGAYKASLTYTYEGANKTATLNFKVKSGLDMDDVSLTNLEMAEQVNYTMDKKLTETNLDFSVNATWKKKDNSTVTEKISYNARKDQMEIKLVKKGKSEDVFNLPVERGEEYELTISLTKYPAFAAKAIFAVPNEAGYYTLEPSLVFPDFTDASIGEGTVKMIVILIDLDPGSSSYAGYDWTQNYIDKIDNYFFGEKTDTPESYNSLKTYYHQASLNKINISGRVFNPVSSSFTMAQITSASRRIQMLNEAVELVKQENSGEDWSTYDTNKDGYFDNLHFITNCKISGTAIDWGSNLWPHQSNTGNSAGTPNSPKGGSYEMTALEYVSDAITVIHEQGHMFGLPDYYDYSYSNADYIGMLDMQSANVLDWNSWSKLSVGWANAIVVDGKLNETKITFQSASKTNQCVIIPANINTFNNSAFDEFFLLELITNEGNNLGHWSKYLSGSVNAAVRLYHVDARLWDANTREVLDDVDDIKNAANQGHYIDLRTSNTYNYGEYAGYQREADHDFKLLSVMQKGGVDTFGSTSESDRHQLGIEDLFRTGDTFDFDTYKHFLSKTGKTITTMDNGETFPYTITFDSVGMNGCAITVTKK